MNFYPPFVGAGVRVGGVRGKPGAIEARLKLRWWNRNAIGTHFGGSMYSMCDAFLVLLLLDKLGPEYIVWDKAAAIRFVRPGKGTIKAIFHITEERVAEIKAEADGADKSEPRFELTITNEEGQTVAEVTKVLYVKRKGQRGPA
ncbi:MAG TPA: DUF4442 domain-containing protein [Bdellovibrionota bacterium]|nr:DUF4442 domain-containing protein [Bdellovibrionota bacterium]